MNEAIGGTFNITIIIVFLVLISGYMAFNVNYSKAFKVKNKIVYTYEAYDNNCTTKCQEEIAEYMRSVGYNAKTQPSGDGYECFNNGVYCTKKFVEGSGDKKKKYYKVTTAVNFDIPIINKILSYIPYLVVTGDTRKIECYDTTDTNVNKC